MTKFSGKSLGRLRIFRHGHFIQNGRQEHDTILNRIFFLFFFSWQKPVYWPTLRARILSHALFIHATTSTPAPTLIVLEKQFTPRLIVAWLFCANKGTFMYFNNQVIPSSPHPHHFSFLYEQRWALFLHLPRYTREIKEGKELCNNQRGICLLSVIGKV